MTPAEFDALEPEDFVGSNRYELIHGVLVVSPPASLSERDPNEDLGYLLRLHREFHPGGGAIDLTVNEQTLYDVANRRRAARAIWIGLGRPPDEEGDIPAILIEFVTPGRRGAVRDYETKRDEYLAAGVKEYWVIDRFLRQMTVFRPGPTGPESTVVPATQTYETPLLPGFVLPLARLIGAAERWAAAKRDRKKRRPSPPRGGDHG